jgi:aspartyl protease family protein
MRAENAKESGDKRSLCFAALGLIAALSLIPALSVATEVHVVAITPGRSASLVIDGGAPLTVMVGETAEGVTVVRADSDGATVRVHGVVQTLALEVYEPSAGAVAVGSSVKLSADARGHFVTSGAVNGRSVRFLVDTGASLTTLSRAQAKRIGLRYRSGPPARAATANGLVDGWLVELDSVRVGSVTVRNVNAMVIDAELSLGLLGMSFLDKFDLEQQGSTLVMRRRR